MSKHISTSKSETTAPQSRSGLFSKVALILTGQMAVTAAGAYVGQGIHDIGVLVGLCIASIAGIFAVRWAAARSNGLGLSVTAIWTFLMGLTLGPAMTIYVKDLGAAVVMQSFLGTAIVMAMCGVVSAVSGINFSNRGFSKFLLIGLLGLIAAGLINIFVSFGHFGTIIYSVIGMILFTGYFLYDFHQLLVKSGASDDTWENAIWSSVGLYLDYMNFVLYLLRLLRELKK